MRSMTVTMALLAGVLITGCIPDQTVSLFPLYDENTLATDPSLEGSWLSEEKDTWKFEPPEGKQYQLSVALSAGAAADTRETNDLKYDVHLVQLAGQSFLDFYTEDAGPTDVPAHAIAMIQIQKDRFHLTWFDPDWIKEKLEQERYLNYLITPGGRIVLTASPRDLQYFFSRHAWSACNGSGPGSGCLRSEFHRKAIHEGSIQ